MNADKRRSFMNVRDVHDDLPRGALLLPDANVTAVLDHFPRLVCNFVSAVRVTEVTGAGRVARDWLPRHVALGLGNRFRRRFTSNERDTRRAVESNVRRSVRGERLCETLPQHISRILTIAIQQALA